MLMADDNKMKTIFYLLGVICFVPMFFWGVLTASKWIEGKKLERIKASNTRTIGHIYKTKEYKEERTAYAEYYVDGIRYETQLKAPGGKTPEPDDMYEIMYDSAHPKDSRIDFDKPIVLEEEDSK